MNVPIKINVLRRLLNKLHFDCCMQCNAMQCNMHTQKTNHTHAHTERLTHSSSNFQNQTHYNSSFIYRKVLQKNKK